MNTNTNLDAHELAVLALADKIADILEGMPLDIVLNTLQVVQVSAISNAPEDVQAHVVQVNLAIAADLAQQYAPQTTMH
jgi:hypothetical protein